VVIEHYDYIDHIKERGDMSKKDLGIAKKDLEKLEEVLKQVEDILGPQEWRLEIHRGDETITLGDGK